VDDSGLDSSICEKHLPYSLLQGILGDLQTPRTLAIGASAFANGASENNLAIKNRGGSELNLATSPTRKNTITFI
jgi:hypothetical protein